MAPCCASESCRGSGAAAPTGSHALLALGEARTSAGIREKASYRARRNRGRRAGDPVVPMPESEVIVGAPGDWPQRDSNTCFHIAARFCQRIKDLRRVESTSIGRGQKSCDPCCSERTKRCEVTYSYASIGGTAVRRLCPVILYWLPEDLNQRARRITQECSACVAS